MRRYKRAITAHTELLKYRPDCLVPVQFLCFLFGSQCLTVCLPLRLQGCVPIAVNRAFDGPDPAAKLLQMIIRSLDADGDGDMEDDHPMVEAMRGGANPIADDHEMVDGWMTPEETTSPSSEPWEPITNTRGHDREHDPYNWDWIPDFDTESDEPCKFPRDLRSCAD